MFRETLVPSTIFGKWENEDEKTFKEEESIAILKIIDLVENM